MNPYEKEFAQYYDIVVHGKEYAQATPQKLEFLDHILQHNAVSTVLDVGCGNGRFLIPLLQKGYTVTGIDLSIHMLTECKTRLHTHGVQGDVICMDFETMDFNQEYNAVILMDSVICYILETEKIISSLKKFYNAVTPHGVIIIEIWNMFAQWKLLDNPRSYKHKKGDTIITWKEIYHFEPFSSLFSININGCIHKNRTLHVFNHEETLRAMTAGEMIMYLKEAQFGNITVYPGVEESKDDDVMLFVAVKE
ncbi:MAG: methyltransferase domain-containing protein [Candidatus Methanofastidiosia archaeon]